MLDLKEGVQEAFADAAMKGGDIVEARSEPAQAPSADLPPPFVNEVALRNPTNGGGFNVSREVVPIPSLDFECPRHCGVVLTLKAGMTLEQCLGGHSCKNAIGHKAFEEELLLIASAREKGWRLGSVISIDRKKDEINVRLADGEYVRMTAGSHVRGDRLWVKRIEEGDPLPGCKETRATKGMWIVERADK